MENKKNEYNHYNYDQINKFFDAENKKNELKLKEYNDNILLKLREHNANHSIKLKEHDANILVKYAIIFLILVMIITILYLSFNFTRWIDSDKSAFPKTAQIITDKNILIENADIQGLKNITIDNAIINRDSNDESSLEKKSNMSKHNSDMLNDESEEVSDINLESITANNHSLLDNSNTELTQIYKCNSILESGDNKPKIFEMELDSNKGNILFEYQTFQAKDLMRIVYENKILFDTGCVGTNTWESKKIVYDGNSNKLDIHVLPNCLGTEPETKWKINSICK